MNPDPVVFSARQTDSRYGRQRKAFIGRLAFLTMAAFFSAAEPTSYFAHPIFANSHPHSGSQTKRPNATNTIRVRVNLVPIDVAATDENGRPVANLKKEDFLIFEAGRQQEIRHFATQVLTPEAPEPAPPLRAVSPLDLAPQSARTFVILMGRGRIQTPFGAVDALIRFVRKDLLPQDCVALFAYNRATAFTTDHEAIAQLLERFKSIHERIESWFEIRMKGLAAIYGSTMPESFQTEINKIFAIPKDSLARQIPSRQDRDATTKAKDADKVLEEALIPAWSPTRNEFTKLESDAITDLPFDEFASAYAATNQDLQNIYACVRYMRLMQGEKHLLYFTPDGLFLPRLDYENGLAAYANDARVAIDTFQTGGTPYLPSTSRVFAVSSLRSISQLTGGQASIREDISKALARVNESTRTTYLLGYYPQDEDWNGKYRRIDVKVKRPGIRLAFRHGYFASESVRSYNQEEIVASSRMSAALGYASDLGDIPFWFNAILEPLGVPQIRVDVQVEVGKIGLKSVEGFYTGKLYAAVFSADDQGHIVGDNWGTVDINFSVDTMPEMIQSGVRFSMTVPHKLSKQVLKVIVYDTGSDRIGSKRYVLGK